MKGSILDYSIQTNSGIISGDDQNRYKFTGAEWRGQRPPTRGDRVDFDIDSTGNAIQIFNALAHSNPVQNISNQLDKISDQNKAEEQFNMIDWFVKCLKNYANFSGRARRKEYWFFIVVQIGLIIIASIIDSVIFNGPSIFYALTVLGLFIPSLSVAIRRMHDTGRSGWLTLISLIPLVGLIVIYWLASETKQETNQWGQPAK